MPDLVLSAEGRVGRILLNRPDSRNALTSDMFLQIAEALRVFESDPGVHVIVITGAGTGFCSGADLRNMKGAAHDQTDSQRIHDLMQKCDIVRLLHRSNKICVAAINGDAAGAGLSIALACDFRFAARSARLHPAFAKIGLAADLGIGWTLARLTGPVRAQEILLSADPLSSESALACGILSAVHDDDAFADAVSETVDRLARGPALAQRVIKSDMRNAGMMGLEDYLAAESEAQIRLTRSADHTEAIAAFREKRAPVFHGA